jgi:hypothetical protein
MSYGDIVGIIWHVATATVVAVVAIRWFGNWRSD